MMSENTYPSSCISQVPAECYNRLRLAHSREGGCLQLGVAGLSDNVVIINGSGWKCWNRRLGVLLMTWQNFHPGGRTSLDQPVPCTLIVHHSYSRTVIHRLYDGLVDGVKRTERLVATRLWAEVVPITNHK
ncbi:hypothetical protein MNBD_GAMMA13-88 [hydrothermal vent metagenome]|uniref:Uncharacterized protein n=1 Tax=hydrothermal vent metagenome TaxID=652676 RepID=A0A3B0YV50_9ZZZZ